jgi:hypothetical protein
VVNAVRSAKGTAFVLPEGKGWVTAVYDPTTSEHLAEKAFVSLGVPVLEYRYEQDYYWEFKVYRQGWQTIEYLCDWSRPGLCKFSDIDADELTTTLGIALDPSDVTRLNRLLRPRDKEALFLEEPYLRIPEILGIEWFDGLSFEVLENNQDAVMQQIPGLERV